MLTLKQAETIFGVATNWDQVWEHFNEIISEMS